MNNKQLAEMIKRFHAKKLQEIIGKPKEFYPKHGKATHGEEPNSPNQYVPSKVSEEQLDELGPTHAAGLNKQSGVISKMPSDRNWGGNQVRSIATYTAEENKQEVELGKTDTNQTGEKISMNPKTSSATGDTTKNTTVKETKEK